MSAKLASGTLMPLLGLGTWRSLPPEAAYDATKAALSAGYRHIDAAWIYGNEDHVGRALQEAIAGGVAREDLFVTTKLWNTFHNKDKVRPAFQESLSKLGVGYLDLYLIHWPMAFVEGESSFPVGPDGLVIPNTTSKLEETWAELEKLVDEGLVKSIGVSNFTIPQIQRILDVARLPISVLQIELHPYLAMTETLEFCKQHNIVVTAYSPLGSSGRPTKYAEDPVLLEDPVVLEVAAKYNKTAAQVLIRYQMDRGIVVIPKSQNPARIAQNFDVFDFTLAPEDLDRITALNRDWKAILFGSGRLHPEFPFHDIVQKMGVDLSIPPK